MTIRSLQLYFIAYLNTLTLVLLFKKALLFIMATYADITKAKDILAWQPRIKLEQGVESAVQWFIENRSWAKKIKL